MVNMWVKIRQNNFSKRTMYGCCKGKEENIPFKDKDNWEVIRSIKRKLARYARKNGIGTEQFIGDMDVNGNNLMVDVDRKTIYFIDPYIPQI